MKKELLLSALAAILVATCFGTTAANADNVETETKEKYKSRGKHRNQSRRKNRVIGKGNQNGGVGCRKQNGFG